MLQHIALYNALFATTQLLIGCGMLFRRSLRLALAGSIAWALAVWWFGESLGGIFTGALPLAGFPGAVMLYALIAVLLWPAGRTPDGQAQAPQAGLPGISGHRRAAWRPLGECALACAWGSFAYSLLRPRRRWRAGQARYQAQARAEHPARAVLLDRRGRRRDLHRPGDGPQHWAAADLARRLLLAAARRRRRRARCARRWSLY
jgi:hypothetical protein